MKEEVAKVWVEALRSGKYKQASRALKISDGETDRFCCLGVLCDISGLGEWIETRYLTKGDLNVPESVEMCAGWLNKDMTEWAGMRTGFGAIPAQRIGSLMNMNDNGYSFKEIADMIDKHWKDI